MDRASPALVLLGHGYQPEAASDPNRERWSRQNVAQRRGGGGFPGQPLPGHGALRPDDPGLGHRPGTGGAATAGPQRDRGILIILSRQQVACVGRLRLAVAVGRLGQDATHLGSVDGKRGIPARRPRG